LCYARRVGAGQEILTSCRPSAEECKKLESRAIKGSRTIVAGTLSRACREIGEAGHPADLLGERENWTASSKVGSFILKGLCPLKDLPGTQMTVDDFETSIGPLSTGMRGRAVVQALGRPETKGKKTVEGATGDTIQYWNYDSQGLWLKMAVGGGAAVLTDINVGDVSKLKTREGVGIGSQLSEAKSIYSSAISSDYNGDSDDTLVVGSVYWGLFLTHEDGVVSSMFYGTGAE